MIRQKSLPTYLRALAAGTLLVTMPSWAEAEDRVLLDYNMQTLPPADWAVEGYAFGMHNPIPNERQKQAPDPSPSSSTPSNGNPTNSRINWKHPSPTNHRRPSNSFPSRPPPHSKPETSEPRSKSNQPSEKITESSTSDSTPNPSSTSETKTGASG